MARELTGSVYPAKGGYGIRWRENTRREHYCPPFRTKRDARAWFDENVKPRLRRHAPSADVTLDAFADLFIARHDGAPSTVKTLEDRLRPARAKFGAWTLGELEHAADDIAAWRATLTDGSRYRHTSALRQCLQAAVRWRYIDRNPAVEAGRNPQPRGGKVQPFTRPELDAVVAELDERWAAAVVFAAETGLRPEEWIALEVGDVDRRNQIVNVHRKYAKGRLTPYPKTSRSQRAVPLTGRAVLAAKSDRIPLLFPAPEGGHLSLDNWRSRTWYPALGLAGVEQRGPYALRHTFATQALAAGVSTFELARVMGTSIEMIDRTYGHLVHDAYDSIRARLEANG
jgi:integrase